MKRPIHKLLLVGLLAVAVMLPGIAQAQELAKNQKLRIATPIRDIRSLDPAQATLTGEKDVVAAIFNGLLRLPFGKVDIEAIEGDLAEKWEVSPDGLVWNFTLRKGVKWHKGYGEVTSEDVKFTFERIKDPATASPFAKGYENLDKVEVLDSHRLKLILKKPDPFFPQSIPPPWRPDRL